MRNKFNFQHEQHSKEFEKELNSVNANIPFIPFRISDETWLVGKYKNFKIKDIPKNYLNWAIKNFNLSQNSITILKKYINEKG